MTSSYSPFSVNRPAVRVTNNTIRQDQDWIQKYDLESLSLRAVRCLAILVRSETDNRGVPTAYHVAHTVSYMERLACYRNATPQEQALEKEDRIMAIRGRIHEVRSPALIARVMDGLLAHLEGQSVEAF